jgi:ribose/xylose/arabinose/galactoside ABC-type transport system permease subunit
MIASTLMSKGGINPWIAALITMAACLAIGAANGLLVAKCKLPPFIATLGTMTIARGIAQLANNNYNTDSIAKILGEDVKGRYAELKKASADRCARLLGTIVKPQEVQYHHEIYNQYIWNQF